MTSSTNRDCSGQAGIARPGRWLLVALVGLVALLLPAAVDTVGRAHRVPAVVALLGVAVSSAAPVIVNILGHRSRRWVVPVSLAALSTLAVGTSVGLGDPWWDVWILMGAISCGAAPGRLGLVVLVAVPVAASLTVVASGAAAGDAWSLALTTFLAGAINLVLVRLLVTIAALRQAQSELASTAVAAERERFSRDLHDLLGHTLSVIVVKAEAVRRLSQRDPDAAMQHTLDIETIGRQALVDVREAVGGYRRTTVAAELARAVDALHAAGITVEVRPPDVPLPPAVDEAFAWVVREGVTNVVRHSGARCSRLAVECSAGTATLELTDDGSGATAQSGSGSTGLSGLRQRLAAVGGHLEAGPDGDGFRLLATAPVDVHLPLPVNER